METMRRFNLWISVLMLCLVIVPSYAHASGRRRTGGAAQGIIDAIQMQHEERVAALSQPQVYIMPSEPLQGPASDPTLYFLSLDPVSQHRIMAAYGIKVCPLDFLLYSSEMSTCTHDGHALVPVTFPPKTGPVASRVRGW